MALKLRPIKAIVEILRNTILYRDRDIKFEAVGSLLAPNIVRVIKSRRLRWAGHVTRMEVGRSAIKTFIGKRPLGRPKRGREDNIGMNLKEIGVNAGIGLILLRIGIIGQPL